MKKGLNGKLSEKRIHAALNQAAMDAVEAHRKAGTKLVVWQDGRTRWIDPDDVARPKNGAKPKRKRN